MKPNPSNSSKITRKKFLNTCGSVLAGGSIAGVSAVLLHKSAKQNRGGVVPKDLQYAEGKPALSPYRLTASFGVADGIEGFELWDDKLIVASPNSICIYNLSGSLLNSFAVGNDVRDIAVDNGLVYLLFPARIEVFNMDGGQVCDWEACSDRSDYCSFAVAAGSVFVTDASNKNICKYSTDGNFERFIQSPNGFVIPSYTFGIACIDGVVYCSNSGRHQVEMFTPDGEYIGFFGQPGAVAGRFCGCCNPVHLARTPTGEIITSEKGTPRISCYGSNGQFRSVLLDHQALGGGNKAYDVKVQGDRLFVAGKNMVSTFQYDKTQASAGACSGCGVRCPLRG